MKTMSEREFIREEIARKMEFHDFDGKFHPEKVAVMSINPNTITLEELQASTTVLGEVPNHCTECGRATWDTVKLGATADNEPAEARICISCLRKALDLIEKK